MKTVIFIQKKIRAKQIARIFNGLSALFLSLPDIHDLAADGNDIQD